MKISVSIKEQACERLLHFHPKKTIARELGISASVVRDWSFFVNKGDFAWISERSVLTRKGRHHQAILYWIEHYPIGYSDVARLFGIRPSDLYRKIKRYIARSPSQHLPAKIRLWDCLRWHGTGDAMVDKARIRQMVSERLSKAKTKEQLDKEVNDILITYECLFQEVLSDCKDEVKKKELQLYHEQLKQALASRLPAKY